MLHEIGCCYLELNYPEKARDYALCSIAAAEEMFEDMWQLRASVLAGQCECNSFFVLHFENLE